MPAAAAVLAASVLAPSLRWDVVNDVVMGGVSTGRAAPLDGGGVRFEGELSLDNNGGFASIRSARAALPLAGAEGLRVTVLGDGRVWQLTLRRSDVPIRGGSYRAAIETTAGEVTTHELAWADFQATSFGRPIPGAPPLSAGLDRVVSIGLLVADKQPGPFAIELRSVEPLGASPATPTDADTRLRVQQSFAAAIRHGVPTFNAGRPDLCAAHYRTAIESAVLLGEAGLSVQDRLRLQEALVAGAGQDAEAAAWTYRGAMDAVLSR